MPRSSFNWWYPKNHTSNSNKKLSRTTSDLPSESKSEAQTLFSPECIPDITKSSKAECSQCFHLLGKLDLLEESYQILSNDRKSLMIQLSDLKYPQICRQNDDDNESETEEEEEDIEEGDDFIINQIQNQKNMKDIKSILMTEMMKCLSDYRDHLTEEENNNEFMDSIKNSDINLRNWMANALNKLLEEIQQKRENDQKEEIDKLNNILSDKNAAISELMENLKERNLKISESMRNLERSEKEKEKFEQAIHLLEKNDRQKDDQIKALNLSLSQKEVEWLKKEESLESEILNLNIHKEHKKMLEDELKLKDSMIKGLELKLQSTEKELNDQKVKLNQYIEDIDIENYKSNLKQLDEMKTQMLYLKDLIPKFLRFKDDKKEMLIPILCALLDIPKDMLHEHL